MYMYIMYLLLLQIDFVDPGDIIVIIATIMFL